MIILRARKCTLTNLLAAQVVITIVVFRATTVALASDALASSTTAYGYDHNGNMTSRSDGTSTDTFTYDHENHLVAAEIRIGPDPAGPITYRYDADGLCTSKSVNGVTTGYLVDKNRDYAQVLGERTDAQTVSYTYGNDLITMNRSGSGASYYHFDGQHSSRQLTNAAGAPTDTYTYDAFGNEGASTGTTANNYGYVGEQHDPDVGLTYLRARYYDQSLGRFLSRDRLPGAASRAASLHRYTYAENDPVARRDPTGLFSLLDIGAALSIQSILIAQFGATSPAPGNPGEWASIVDWVQNGGRPYPAEREHLKVALGFAQYFVTQRTETLFDETAWTVSGTQLSGTALKKWFGRDDRAHIASVYTVYDLISRSIAERGTNMFIRVLKCPPPSEEATACTLTWGSSFIVLLPDNFFKGSEISMAGTIIHELAHGQNGLDVDGTHGGGGNGQYPKNVLEMAYRRPKNAIKNAYAYEWAALEGYSHYTDDD